MQISSKVEFTVSSENKWVGFEFYNLDLLIIYIYIYIYIRVCVCVCVFVCTSNHFLKNYLSLKYVESCLDFGIWQSRLFIYVFANQFVQADTRSILKLSLKDLKLVFSFKTGRCTKVKEPSLPDYFPIVVSRIVGFMPFPWLSYLPTPSARAGYDTRSIFKRSLTGLNSEFSFS